MEKRKWFHVDNSTEILGIKFYLGVNNLDYAQDRVLNLLEVGIFDFRKTKNGECGWVFLRFKISKGHGWIESKVHPEWEGIGVSKIKFTLNLFGKIFTKGRW